MAPCLICYFIVILLYIEEKSLLVRNLTTSQNCMENFSVLMLQNDVSKCWKMVEFPKILMKMKNCKTFYKGQTASRVQEIIKPLPHPFTQPDKILLCLWNRNGAVQMSFLTPNRKIFKERKVFGNVAKIYYFQCQVN